MIIPTTKKDDVDYLEQHALSMSMGMIFKFAVRKYEFKPFVMTFLKTALFQEYYTNHTIFSQSALYVLELFQEDLDNANMELPMKNEEYDADVAYWMGYLIAEWYQEYEMNPLSFTEEQFNWLYFNYDTLHTQSVKYVAEVLLEEYPFEIKEKE